MTDDCGYLGVMKDVIQYWTAADTHSYLSQGIQHKASIRGARRYGLLVGGIFFHLCWNGWMGAEIVSCLISDEILPA